VLCGICSYVHDNAGLCGPLVSVGSVGTSYSYFGTSGTNLGNDCPTTSPTASPTMADPSVDSDGRNGIMRAALAGE
jgi:hypothetical protein